MDSSVVDDSDLDRSRKSTEKEARYLPNTRQPTLPAWKRFVAGWGWTPKRCRQDPGREFEFTTSLMLTCALACAISAGNLFYIYPVLNKAAEDFGVSYQRASLIPQLLQGGYGVGILLFCPLGDVFRLRPVILTLITTAAAAWLGLCISNDFRVFTALSFVSGLLTVSPQLLLPLIGSLAPPDRKATAVSIVLAGLMMGLAIPRVVTGIVTQYTDWRNVYWAAFALQCLLICVMWLLFPDFPRPDPSSTNHLRKYTRILGSVLKMTVTQPILAYGCLVTMLTNAVLASFWTTLTAHLAAPPFNFGPLNIGLFSLIAVGTTTLIPIYTHFMIESLATYFVSTLGLVFGILCICLDSFVGSPLGIGGPIIQALGVDFGLQVASVAYRAAVYRSLPQNRANVIFTACAFLGQLMGTSVGNSMYAKGGWQRVGIFHIAFTVATLVVVYARGPEETRWVGWRGGASLRLKGLGKVGETEVREAGDKEGSKGRERQEKRREV